MKKRDIAVLAALVLIASALAAAWIFAPVGVDAVCVVYVDNGRIASFPLTVDTEYRIETENGSNLLIIKDGTAYISEADCPDKICIKTGRLTAEDSAKTIVCLPHKVTVCIEYE